MSIDGLKRLIKGVLSRWLPWSVRRLIYRKLAIRYIRSLPVALDRTRKTIIVLNHFFDQDVRALALANKRFNLVPIDTVTLFRGAKIFFDEDVRELEVRYAGADPARVARYRDEYQRIFDLLNEKLTVDLVVTASDVFYWVREFIAAARHRGVKTVVLDKEGTLSPYDFQAEAKRIRDFAPFMSDHIFVWSDRQREFWRRIGVDDPDITVVGQPRSDLLFREKRTDLDRLFPAVKPLVALFSYMDEAYIPVRLIRSEGLTWRAMKVATHDEVYRLAGENPEYNFVVKTHPQQPDLAELRSQYRRDNLRVVGGSAVGNELLQRSELVIAFQTTAIIEAMFLNKRVIYTYWDPLVSRLENDLLPFHEAKGIRVARSFEEFRDLCDRFFEGDTSAFEFADDEIEQRNRFVSEYFYQPDGHVCERFFEAVERFVQ